MPRKVFPCGHKGLGKYCHLCAQQQQQITNEKQIRQSQQEDKQAWEALFKGDCIDLRKLPHKKLIIKAREMLTELSRGVGYEKLGGKRMNYNRDMISIPLGSDYRLLCQVQDNGTLLPLKIMSHEAYNVKKPGAKL